jgi:amino acid adenylation domain-containing protein
MTYQQLCARANSLGHQLRSFGVRPNQLVAVVMDKGWEQVVAVVGILLAGAAYLPIDPSLPPQRQQYLLENGQVQVLITQSWLAPQIEFSPQIQTICLDTQVVDPTLPLLESVQTPEDLAYVIYTSGSTGLPKGVALDHRGVVNTIVDLNRRYDIGSEDKVLALSALNFDLSVYDIFGTLAAGGTIVIPDATGTKDPAHWLELMQQQQVTVWNSVPALMQMLVDYLPSPSHYHPALSSLKLVMLSGDWLPLTLPEQIHSLNQDVQVVSLGGATEASIWSICYPIEQVDPNWKSIPYGLPLANQQFYVLHAETLEPCPTWVTGQLYIGGVGLAKGYWQDEAKTNASFITHPRTGERLYKTGDLGRYLPDGNIEFLGRADFQVKIRGYRIELGEIEAALKQHPSVHTAVVVAVGNDEKSKDRLVAHIVLDTAWKANQTRSQSEASAYLQTYLQEKLPEYMLPSAFVIQETLPLSSNGKVDRKILAQQSHLPPELETGYVAPRNDLEQAIASILQTLISVEKIGIHDNFFYLGANSLHIVQLHNQLRTTLQQDFSIATLFQYPNIHDLTQHLSK